MNRRATRKYELPLLVAIIGILSVLLLNALESMRAEIEEAAMQSEVAALRVELLDRLAHRQRVGGPLPVSPNPLRWVERTPQNYLGERDSAPEETGVWYFDTRREVLVYRFRAGHEAVFRLIRGREASGVAANLGGVGLQRVDAPGEGAKK